MPDTVSSTFNMADRASYLKALLPFYLGDPGTPNGYSSVIPLKIYGDMFTNVPPAVLVGRTKPEELIKHRRFVHEKFLSIIGQLNDDDFRWAALAYAHWRIRLQKTEFQTIDWNIKLTMHHYGQTGIIRRIEISGLISGLIAGSDRQ